MSGANMKAPEVTQQKQSTQKKGADWKENEYYDIKILKRK